MPTLAARQGRAHLTTQEEKGTPQIKIHYFKSINNNHSKHNPHTIPPSHLLFPLTLSLSLSLSLSL